MIKKIMIVFVFVLVMIGAAKVQAIQTDDVVTMKEEILENLLEKKVNDQWKEMRIPRYLADNMDIYKLGDNYPRDNQITIYNKRNFIELFRVVKNAHRNTFNSINEEKDAYVATKIALDFINFYYDSKTGLNLDSYYRTKSDLEGTLKTRADRIIKYAKELVNIGINGKETFEEKIEITEGKFKIDEQNNNYYSKSYKINVEGLKIKEYEILRKDNLELNYKITEIDSENEKNKFQGQETQFKIMVPKEKIEEPFDIELEIKCYYTIDRIFTGSDILNNYVVYSDTIESKSIYVMSNNKESNLSVNFVDEETGEKIFGGIVEINGKNYTLNKENEILLERLAKETVNVKIVKVPDEYITFSDNYNINIEYNENHIENIPLKHKQGHLDILDNVGNASYEIYDLKSNMICRCSSNEDGISHVERINTGRYVLKQTSVGEEYKLAEEVEFDITYNKVSQVYIENEEIKDKEEAEKEENEEVKDKEEAEKEENEEIKDKEEAEKEENEEMKDKEEAEKEKNEEIKDKEEAEKEENDEIKDKEETENNKNFSTSKTVATLPRTGRDNFIFKVIIIDLSLCACFIFLVLIRQKKQTALSKQSALSKIKSKNL